MITKKLTAYYKNHTVEQTRTDIVEKIMLSLIIFGVVMAGVTGVTMDISNAECVGCDLATPVEKNTPVLPVENEIIKDDNITNKKPTVWRRFNKN